MCRSSFHHHEVSSLDQKQSLARVIMNIYAATVSLARAIFLMESCSDCPGFIHNSYEYISSFPGGESRKGELLLLIENSLSQKK